MRRWGETIVRWVRTVLKFQERPWWPRGTGIDENGEGRPDGDRERERGLRAARGGGVGWSRGWGSRRRDRTRRGGAGWGIGSWGLRRPGDVEDRPNWAQERTELATGPNWARGVGLGGGF